MDLNQIARIEGECVSSRIGALSARVIGNCAGSSSPLFGPLYNRHIDAWDTAERLADIAGRRSGRGQGQSGSREMSAVQFRFAAPVIGSANPLQSVKPIKLAALGAAPLHRLPVPRPNDRRRFHSTPRRTR